MSQSYIVEFEYSLEGVEDSIKAETTVTAESPIREDQTADFTEIARELFRSIDGCTEVRVLKVMENSEMVQDILEILNKNTVSPSDLDDEIIIGDVVE